MYLIPPSSHPRIPPPGLPAGAGTSAPSPVLLAPGHEPQRNSPLGSIAAWLAWQPRPSDPGGLRRRDSLQDQNVMIGVIVGVVLLLFLIGLVYFLHRYHGSIRFSRTRRKGHHNHHHHHRYGGSSKGSHTSSDIGPPPPPPV